MASFPFVLYDTAVFGTAVPTDFNLFQALPTDPKLSNTRGPGAMPASESFAINRIAVFADFAVLEANVGTWFNNALLQIIESNFVWLQIPLQVVLAFQYFTGADASTAAANQAHVAISNPPYDLRPSPIVLAGGKPFTVRVTQGTAAAATSNIKVVLDGILTLP